MRALAFNQETPAAAGPCVVPVERLPGIVPVFSFRLARTKYKVGLYFEWYRGPV